MEQNEVMEEEVTAVWECTNVKFEESKNKPGVLGTIEGEFCFENKPSRNKRIYPEGTWTKAISRAETRRFIDDGLMIGTVGHLEADLDELIREQKVSHKMVELKVNENGVGVGKAEILDMPVGRAVYTLLQSGSNLYVSSKATGRVESRRNDGVDIIDPKSIRLQRFDFVTDPGFMDANPKLKESLNEALGIKETDEREVEKIDSSNNTGVKETNNFNSIDMEDLQMAEEKALERIMTEKLGLETKVADLTNQLGAKDNEIGKLMGSVEESNKQLEILKDSDTQLKAVMETIGNTEEASIAIAESKKISEEFGSADEISKVHGILESYQTCLEGFGTPEEIKKLIEDIQAELKEYNEIGKSEDIKEAFEQGKVFADGIKAEKIKEQASDLGSRFGVTEDKVESLLGKQSFEEVEGLLEGLSSDVGFKPDKKESTDENKEETPASSIGKLFETYAVRVDK